MRELLLRDRYTCTPICHIALTLEGLTAAIGPAGDALYVPMRITGGRMSGLGMPKQILSGSDFTSMYADEQLVHEGMFVAADPAGDVVVWYNGVSQGHDGTYDGILDGQLPEIIPCRLSIRSVSTSPEWKWLNRRPLLGIGAFDGRAGTLTFTLLSATENETRN